MKSKINTSILKYYNWFKINNLKFIDLALELYSVEICFNKYLQLNGCDIENTVNFINLKIIFIS